MLSGRVPTGTLTGSAPATVVTVAPCAGVLMASAVPATPSVVALAVRKSRLFMTADSHGAAAARPVCCSGLFRLRPAEITEDPGTPGEWSRTAGEPVHAESERFGRIGDRHQLEAGFGVPRADPRYEIRRPPVSRPQHGTAGAAQLRARRDGRVDVGVADVAEDTTDQYQISRRESRVVVGQRGIADDHLDPGQPGAGRRPPRHGSVARIKLDQPRDHVGTARMAGERPDQIPPLPGAHA